MPEQLSFVETGETKCVECPVKKQCGKQSDDDYSGLRFNGQFYFCPLPFVLDTYQGCSHGCLYCFARTGLMLRYGTQDRDFNAIKRFDPRDLRKVFAQERTKHNAVLCDAVLRRMPLHIGGLSDPFQPCEAKYKITLECLKILHENGDYPFVLSTKGTLCVGDEYTQYMKNCLMQFSIVTTDEELARKIEPAAPSPSQRFAAIKKLKEKGIPSIVRCQPLIPNVGDGEKALRSLVEASCEAGATGIAAEYLKLSRFRNEKVDAVYKELNEACGGDLLSLYDIKAEGTASDYELAPEHKLKALLRLRDLCHEHGLKFFSADNAFRALGDSPICCGLTVEDYAKLTGGADILPCYNLALFKAKENGKVSYTELFGTEPLPVLNHDASIMLNMGNRGNNETYAQLSKEVWNNRKSANNPMNFFIGLRLAGADEKGNKVYAYKKNAFEELGRTGQKTL